MPGTLDDLKRKAAAIRDRQAQARQAARDQAAAIAAQRAPAGPPAPPAGTGKAAGK